MKPLIGVVTVLFNSDEVLPGFFKSLARQTDVAFKLYVLDNSKTDSGSRLSKSLANKYGISIEVIFNNANLGVAKGNNQGIQLAQRDGCEYVLLSNNDIEFEAQNLLGQLEQCIRTKKLDAVVPKIYYYGSKNKLWFAGGTFRTLRATTPHIGDEEEDIGQYDQPKVIEYAPTCFMLMRTSIFSSLGLMDEKYFVYYDDTDFLWRMKINGYKLGYEPSGTIAHKVSFSTGGDISVFSIFYGSRNRIYFIRKHYKQPLQFASLLVFFASRLIKAASYTASQRAALFKGMNEGLKLSVD